MKVAPLPHGPVIREAEVGFYLHDPSHRLTGVALYQEVQRPNDGPEFDHVHDDGLWRLRLPRPEVDRMEYGFIVRHNDGMEMVCDPGNPMRAPGPFGDKSVIEFPGYLPPAWAGAARPERGETKKLEVRSRALRLVLQVVLWSSHGTKSSDRLPLLVCNDGLDYSTYSGLLLMLDVLTAAGRLPPMRAALIQPVKRDEIYSASASFGRALAYEVLPSLDEVAPTPRGRSSRVGMGGSLGALAMLHTHRRHPSSFGALFLQSGSYFRTGQDGHERLGRFPWIARFVAQVTAAEQWAYPIPVTMTCGCVEENLSNNRVMRDALHEQGYEVRLVENRDAHNWVGWRDTFDPHLVELLQALWG